MGNEPSSESKAQASPRQASPTVALVFGTRGVGKHSVWLQAVTGKTNFNPDYLEQSPDENEKPSAFIEQVGDTKVESIFCVLEGHVSTQVSTHFKHARIFVLVYDVCDRESFLTATAHKTSMDLLVQIQVSC